MLYRLCKLIAVDANIVYSASAFSLSFSHKMAGIELNQALYGGLSPFLKRGIAAVSSSIPEDSTRLAPGPSDKGYRQGEGSVVSGCCLLFKPEWPIWTITLQWVPSLCKEYNR